MSSGQREQRIVVFQKVGNREAAAHYEIGYITGGSCIPGNLIGARFVGSPGVKYQSLYAAWG